MESKETSLTINPVMSISEATGWYEDFTKFIKTILKKDLDYGVIPGSTKPTLLKPGAEKLKLVYGLETNMERTESITNTDSRDPHLDFTYKCTASKNGKLVAQCEGNANSYESKYRYIWSVRPKPTPEKEAELKAAGLGKNRKGYGDKWEWVERTVNPDLLGLKNTMMKMSQKRAFVGAILLATGASEFFTQDIEDMEINHIPEEAVKTEIKVTNTPASKASTGSINDWPVKQGGDQSKTSIGDYPTPGKVTVAGETYFFNQGEKNGKTWRNFKQGVGGTPMWGDTIEFNNLLEAWRFENGTIDPKSVPL